MLNRMTEIYRGDLGKTKKNDVLSPIATAADIL
jgi:hypothetical protein